MQLALEHKALPYERKVLSFAAGDTRKPEFVALNPRHRVPVLVDGDFVLYESNAIVEYLDEAYPAAGAPLFPGDVRTRALVRRLIIEVDNYFDEALDPVTTQAFGRSRRSAIRSRSPPAARRWSTSSRCSPARCAASSSPARCPRPTSHFYPLVAFLQAQASEAARPRRGRHADARARRMEGAHRGAAVLRVDDSAALGRH